VSGFTDQGPGPLAPPFDFSQPLPLVVAAFELSDGVATCRFCAFCFSFDTHADLWQLELIRHVQANHDFAQPRIGERYAANKTITRAPRAKKARAPSAPYDLQSADLFKE
jgi:hypothetical protein